MSARPRLLIVTPDFPPGRGGIQLMSYRLAGGIERFNACVVTLASPEAAVFDRAHDLAVRRVGAERLTGAQRAGLLNAAAVHEGLRQRPAAVLSMHAVASPSTALLRRALGIPTLQIFHAEEITARPRLAAYAAQADCSIAVSHYTERLLAHAGAAPRRLRVISPGVDLPAQTGPLPSDRPTVVTVARLEERYKGHDVMMRALSLIRAKVPDVLWVVIGEGSLRPGLEQLARDHCVRESVHFTGSIADEERDVWLRRAALFAMPSRLGAGGLAGEGFGISYMEAAAFSKPVVAGNVGGAVEAVDDGSTGWLVDPSDPVELAGAVTTLLLDRALATRMGQAGAIRASRHAWPVFVSRVEQELLELLLSRRPRTSARATA